MLSNREGDAENYKDQRVNLHFTTERRDHLDQFSVSFGLLELFCEFNQRIGTLIICRCC